MYAEQIEYHAKRFFDETITHLSEDSEFEIDEPLRSYQYRNRKDLYKGDHFERVLLLDYLQRNKYVEFTEKRIITNYYKLGQCGKDIVAGRKKLFY